ncbi:hypothetical protein H2248_003195 [Termitomyces sp. 'cryptogamus']|nr:hypothetical protein H2248_003195 [Termitomyces sp. 'cryptogamus']
MSLTMASLSPCFPLFRHHILVTATLHSLLVLIPFLTHTELVKFVMPTSLLPFLTHTELVSPLDSAFCFSHPSYPLSPLMLFVCFLSLSTYLVNTSPLSAVSLSGSVRESKGDQIKFYLLAKYRKTSVLNLVPQ